MCCLVPAINSQELESQRLSELDEAKEVYTILSREVERLRDELEAAKARAEAATLSAAMIDKNDVEAMKTELERRSAALAAAQSARAAADQELKQAQVRNLVYTHTHKCTGRHTYREDICITQLLWRQGSVEKMDLG